MQEALWECTDLKSTGKLEHEGETLKFSGTHGADGGHRMVGERGCVSLETFKMGVTEVERRGML